MPLFREAASLAGVRPTEPTDADALARELVERYGAHVLAKIAGLVAVGA